MRHKKIKLSALLLLGLGLPELQAQEIIPASGGNASGSGGTLNYTIGQAMYNTNFGTSGSEAQGVQQPYEISVISGIDDNTEIYLTYTVYPNPTTDILTLKVNDTDEEQLEYKLYTINGMLLESKRVISNETSVSMTKYAPSIYILKVYNETKEVKTFKIIKK